MGMAGQFIQFRLNVKPREGPQKRRAKLFSSDYPSLMTHHRSQTQSQFRAQPSRTQKNKKEKTSRRRIFQETCDLFPLLIIFQGAKDMKIYTLSFHCDCNTCIQLMHFHEWKRTIRVVSYANRNTRTLQSTVQVEDLNISPCAANIQPR